LFTLRASKTTIKELPVKTEPAVDVEILSSIDTEAMDDSHVYVHCHVSNPEEGMLVRIWRTTFLVDRASGVKSELVHAENISYAPQWTMIPGNVRYSFLLIFSSLSKACSQFDLVEEIPQPGGFLVTDIRRNETDIYHIDVL